METRFEVTNDDVLRGDKEIAVDLRNGETVTVKVRAMSWRLALAAAELNEPGERMVRIVLSCVEKERATDDFLNTLHPHSVCRIGETAMALSMGVTKKNPAANAAEPPALPTTTAPNAS